MGGCAASLFLNLFFRVEACWAFASHSCLTRMGLCRREEQNSFFCTSRTVTAIVRELGSFGINKATLELHLGGARDVGLNS